MSQDKMDIQQLKTKSAFDNFIKQPSLNLVHFGTSWSPSCSELNQQLAELQKDVYFSAAYVDAEELVEASYEAKIEAAPTLVMYKEGKEVNRQAGFQPDALRNAITTQTFKSAGPAAHGKAVEAPKKSLNDRLKELINHSRVTLFMKGNAEQPRCGFSRQIVQLLNEHNVAFWTFDILEDEEVRQGLKTFSDWPTYPQLYLDGELLGGLDVIREEIKDASFVSKLPAVK